MSRLLSTTRFRLVFLIVLAVLPGLALNVFRVIEHQGIGPVLALDLGTLALGVALTLAVAWLAVDVYVLKPIKRLVDTSDALAMGDLEARTGLDYEHGEFGKLGRAMDDMARALRDHQSRIVQEEQLRQQNAVLAEASRLKSEFLTSMSHELRTPLNAIIGFSDLLITEPAADYDHATALTYLQTIRDSGAHLLALINDILDIARVDAGKMDLHTEYLVIADLAGEVCGALRPVAASKNVQLEADVAPAGELIADAAKLRQVLYNLVSNGIKFTPEGGRVTITAERRPEDVLFRVADTGIGIAPADQKRVFETFLQVDGGTSRRYQGSGLGLALTKRLVELHGGSIRVDSQVGEGTNIQVSIPLRPLVEPAPEYDIPEPHRNGQSGKGPLVMVVEDDPRAAQLLTIYLRQGGYSTIVVNDGRDALERAREVRPTAITLDILLPGLDGWSVLQSLKEDPATRDIPVVVVSIVDEGALGRALGAIDYFVKPVEPQALLSLLSRCAPTAEPNEAPTRILVVDDEVHGLDLLTAILEPAGYTVFRAGGGSEGIRLARQIIPDLILLDLMMPKVSGFDVVAALKGDPVTREIPIVIITAKDLTDEDRAVLNGNVAAMFGKGTVGGVELIGWLQEVIARRASYEEES